MASARAKREAARILTRQAEIMRTGVAVSLRLTAGLRRLITTGGKANLKPLRPVLRDAMTVAFLDSRRRAMSLAGYDDALEAFARTMDRDELARVRSEFQTTAFDLVRDAEDKFNDRLRSNIQTLIRGGATTTAAVKQLRENFETLSAHRVETLFRTNVQMAYGAGRFQAYQDPAVQEILWGFEYVTAGDDRVREEHAAMDGTRWPKDDPRWRQWWPPNGWNCRCQVVAVFSDDDEASVKQPDLVDGAEPKPDAGFAFNPGAALSVRAQVSPPPPPPAPRPGLLRPSGEHERYIKDDPTLFAAVNRYTGGGAHYIKVNEMLRDKPATLFNARQAPNQYPVTSPVRTAVILQNAIKNAPPLSVREVHRGLNESMGKKVLKAVASSKDETLQLFGFQSTSINEGVAKDFAAGKVVLRISDPKGLSLGQFSYAGQQEVLLPHGARYKIEGVQDVDDLKIVKLRQLDLGHEVPPLR